MFRTAVLKLHNPSQKKCSELCRAMQLCDQVYWSLLEPEIPTPDGRFFVRALAGELYRRIQEPRLSSALKDGVSTSVAATLASHFALARKQEDTGYPAPPPEPQVAWEEDLARIRSCCGLEEETELRNRLNQIARARVHLRPLIFTRSRDLRLTERNEKWALNLPLWAGRNGSRWFPLAFGKWHRETFLAREYEEGEGLKCGEVIEQEGEFYALLQFQLPDPELVETETFLGIDRGLLKQACYAVVNGHGKMVQVGSLGREYRNLQVHLGQERERKQRNGQTVNFRHYQTPQLEALLHEYSNFLANLARERRAQVVLEDLSISTAGRRVKSAYAKLEKFLRNDLEERGLPAPRQVWAASTSQICSNCGQKLPEARQGEWFFCTCNGGTMLDADENAAINIARRALYRKEDWPHQWAGSSCGICGTAKETTKAGCWLAFHQSFADLKRP